MMDIIDKLEQKFDDQVKKFTESPVKTGLKLVIIIFLLKKAFDWVRD